MSWLSGSYTNWEAPGHEIVQVGDRYLPAFTASATGSSASVIKAADISAVGYAIGVPTSNYITPAMAAAGTEIYGVIPRGGSTDYSANATVYTGTATSDTVKRQIFHIANQIGARFELKYNTNTASSPSVGERVVCGGAGSVQKAASAASNATIAAGMVYSNWVCIAIDATS